jgi:AcrR family transcriptional regulator
MTTPVTASTAAGRGTATPGPPLRADAVRNRERIVDAAREAFVHWGPDVPLDEIARDAGVGNATLYRHFPDRASLIRHVVLAVTDRIADRAEALAADTDTFEALRRFVFHAADERIGALCPLLTEHIDPDDRGLVAARERLEAATEHLMERAHRDGRLREDVGMGDLMVALTQLARPLPGTGRPEISRFVHRHLQILLDGLRAPAGSALLGDAATFEDLRSSVCRRKR